MTRGQQNRFWARFLHFTRNTAPSALPAREQIPMTSRAPEPDLTQYRRELAMGLISAEYEVWRNEGSVIPDDVEAWRAEHAEQIAAQEASNAELARYLDKAEEEAEFLADQEIERQLRAEGRQTQSEFEEEQERRATDPTFPDPYPEAEIE